MHRITETPLNQQIPTFNNDRNCRMAEDIARVKRVVATKTWLCELGAKSMHS